MILWYVSVFKSSANETDETTIISINGICVQVWRHELSLCLRMALFVSRDQGVVGPDLGI